MTQQAQNAIHAAKNRRKWGRYMTFKFLEKRNVPIYLYALALNLEKGLI